MRYEPWDFEEFEKIGEKWGKQYAKRAEEAPAGTAAPVPSPAPTEPSPFWQKAKEIGQAALEFPSYLVKHMSMGVLGPGGLLEKKLGIAEQRKQTPAEKASEFAGELIGSALPIGGIEAGVTRLARPLVEAAAKNVASRLAARALTGAATGAVYEAAKAGIEGKSPEEIAKEAERGAAFFGVGAPVGSLAETAARRLLPGEDIASRLARAALRGGAVGTAGIAAQTPLYPAEQRPTAGDIAKQAGSFALYEAIMSMLTGRPVPVPRLEAKAEPGVAPEIPKVEAPTAPETAASEAPKVRPRFPDSGTFRIWRGLIELLGPEGARPHIEEGYRELGHGDRAAELTEKFIAANYRPETKTVEAPTAKAETAAPPKPEMSKEKAAGQIFQVEAGDTVYYDGVPYKVVDASDPTMLTVETSSGIPIRIGRAAVDYTPSAKKIEAEEKPPETAEATTPNITLAETKEETKNEGATENIPKKPKEVVSDRAVTVKTEKQTPVQVRYAVVNADDLIASHDTNLRPSENYPQELQPRDRTRLATEEQVHSILTNLEPEWLGENPKASEGAPIVGPDLIVEAGNGRVIALKRGYERNHPNIQKYRQWLLDNAEKFGLDKEAVEKVKNPVLVRVRETEVDRAKFAEETNIPSVAAMSATEQAVADAKKLTSDLLSLFRPGENGEILTPANQDFIAAFMRDVVSESDRGRYITADGRISQEGAARIRNAIFAKAYGDIFAIEKLAESTDNNVRNITNAMLIAAPEMAKFKEGVAKGTYHNLDIAPDIVAAMNKLSHLRETGQSVDKYLRQEALFGEDISPEAKDLLSLFNKYKRSAKKIAQLLNSYIEAAKSAGSPNQLSMFGRHVPSKADILHVAVEGVEGAYETSSLFEGEPVRGKQAAEDYEGKVSAEGESGEVSGEEGKVGQTYGMPAGATTQRQMGQQAGATGDIVTKIQILKRIEQLFEVPVWSGSLFRKRAAGEYDPHYQVARTKIQANLPVVAHELGHHLHTVAKFDIDHPELEQLGARLYPKANRNLKKKEGFAEFIRLVITEPKTAEQIAYWSEFRRQLDLPENHEYRDAIFEVQGLCQRFFAGDPVARIKGHIVSDAAVRQKHWLTPKERLYMRLWDAGLPFLKFTQDAFRATPLQRWRGVGMEPGDFDLDALANPYILYRLAGSRYLEWYREFVDILKPVRQYIHIPTNEAEAVGDFETYLVAKHAAEVHAKGKETGLDDADCRDTVARLEKEHPEFKDVAQKIYDFQNRIVDELVKAGNITAELAERLKKEYPCYVPFYRFFETEKGKGPFGPARYANLPAGIKRMKGSQRMILHPLESIARNIGYLLSLADRNTVANAVIDLAEKTEGMGQLIAREPTPVKPQQTDINRIKEVFDEEGIDYTEDLLEQLATTFMPVTYPWGKEAMQGIVMVWRNGKSAFYRLADEDLYRAFMALDNKAVHGLVRLAAYVTRTLRAGAVLSPEFISRNPVRDVLHSMVMGGFSPLNFIEGLYHVAKKDDVYKAWVKNGGPTSTFFAIDREVLQKNLRKELGQLTAKEKLGELVMKPVVKPVEALMALSEAFEAATRVGKYYRDYKKWIKEGLPEEEARARAIYAGKEISVDFGRRGTWGREANMTNAFFNAAVQGSDRVWREFKRRPVGFVLRGLLYITLPTVVLYTINRDNENYKRLPQYIKDMYWLIPYGDNFIKIPKPWEVGLIFGTFVERALRALDQQDPMAFDEFMHRVQDIFMPQILPTLFVPWIEARANKSFFTGLPIVPEREKKLPPYLQAAPSTSITARILGALFNTSPRYIENYVRGYTGGLGLYALNAVDTVVKGAAGIETPEEVAKPPAAKVPGVRAFVAVTPWQPNLDWFYKTLNEMEEEHALEKYEAGDEAVDVPYELTEMRRIDRQLKELRKQARRIENSTELSPEEKRTELEIIGREMEEAVEPAKEIAGVEY